MHSYLLSSQTLERNKEIINIWTFFRRLKNNPKAKATDGKTDLQLALNTAQVGRTFQDRSHVILLKSRSLLPDTYQKSNIYYIVGMGKRGNIVQTYPAMEYRFFPERISVTTDDVICFVWSGKKSFITQFSWNRPFQSVTWFDIRLRQVDWRLFSGLSR